MTNIKATVISMLWVTLCFGATFAKHYTPQWAVHIDGGTEIADSIAFKHGFINRGEIFSDSDMYHFEHRGVVRRSIQPSHEHHERLTQEPQVRWARQQVAKSRKKRDFMQKTSRSYRLKFPLNDPRWPQMWYLNRDGGLDMNVQGAWLEGVTGKGIVVTILDDGLEKDHPDLLQNYDPQASYDVNNHDLDPMPRYEATDSNRHGTRCAGEVAAVANNTICAVGIAFGANVGGVRMLDGDVTDAVEATSLSYHPQHIDIYSASWGPDDDGKTVDGPGELATRAFVEGVKKGRRGKGSIFIWASGNGGRDYDNCNCDGYTNSIWTLSISSATENGLVPWYSEACSSTLATTYSSGATGERQVVTTDLRHECTTSHTGTSASAPLAAGICALALEANNNLTWRDMQHIVVRTSRSKNLDSSDWKINGVGRNVSHSFGYGLMDATAMVKLAREWKTVPEQRRCEVSAPQLDKSIPANSQLALNLTVRECPGVNYLEHVQAKMTLSADRRGDIQIHLTSPAGTRSTLLAKRPHDVSRAGFKNWPFMTVHNWGESPFGVWQLEIHNKGSYLGRAVLREWCLLFYGTEQSLDEKPQSTSSPMSSSVLPALSRNQQRTSNPQKSFPNEKRRKGNNKGRNKNTSTTISPTLSNISPKNPSFRGPLRNRTTLAPRFFMAGITLAPNIISRTMLPPRMEILYPSGPLQFFPNHPSPSVLPNMTFQPQGTSKPGFQYPSKIFPPYSRPKEGRQGNNRPGSSFRPGNSMPSKGLDLRQDGQFDSRFLTATGKENITNNNHHKVNITGWKLILHGTETLPDSSDEDSHGIHGILGSPQVPDVSNNISTRYSNSSAKPKSKPSLPSEKAPDIGNSRPWHDEQHQHNGVERTTIEDTSSGTGCVVLARSGHQCIECEELMFLFDGICVSQCPPRTHVGLSPKGRTACLRCHYSCLACSGPNIDQCLACSPDAYLQSSGLCLPLAINSQLQATRWYFWLFVAFSLNLVVLVLIVLVLVCYIILNWVRQGHQKHHYHIVQQEGGAVRMSKVDYISDSSDEEK